MNAVFRTAVFGCLAGGLLMTPVLASDQDLCGAGDAQKFVGKHIDEVKPQLPEDRNVRVEEPGSIVTMDYRLDRLRVILDEDGIVKEVKCG